MIEVPPVAVNRSGKGVSEMGADELAAHIKICEQNKDRLQAVAHNMACAGNMPSASHLGRKASELQEEITKLYKKLSEVQS